MSTLITLENIRFAYANHPVFHELNLKLLEGETVALLGASGAGKSTLFRLLVGLEKPNDGQITSSLPLGELSSYLTQDDLLLPWRTVLDNLILMGELGMVDGPSSRWVDRARKLLNELGLGAWETTPMRYPGACASALP